MRKTPRYFFGNQVPTSHAQSLEATLDQWYQVPPLPLSELQELAPTPDETRVIQACSEQAKILLNDLRVPAFSLPIDHFHIVASSDAFRPASNTISIENEDMYGGYRKGHVYMRRLMIQDLIALLPHEIGHALVHESYRVQTKDDQIRISPRHTGNTFEVGRVDGERLHLFTGYHEAVTELFAQILRPRLMRVLKDIPAMNDGPPSSLMGYRAQTEALQTCVQALTLRDYEDISLYRTMLRDQFLGRYKFIKIVDRHYRGAAKLLAKMGRTPQEGHAAAIQLRQLFTQSR